MSPGQLIPWTVFVGVPDACGSSHPASPSSAGFPEFSLELGCGTLHLFPSVARWSLSDLFNSDSAQIWTQNTLQAGQAVGQRFCALLNLPVSPHEALLGSASMSLMKFPLPWVSPSSPRCSPPIPVICPSVSSRPSLGWFLLLSGPSTFRPPMKSILFPLPCILFKSSCYLA